MGKDYDREQKKSVERQDVVTKVVLAVRWVKTTRHTRKEKERCRLEGKERYVVCVCVLCVLSSQFILDTTAVYTFCCITVITVIAVGKYQDLVAPGRQREESVVG